MSDFLTDVATLRARAREHIDQSPITAADGADRNRVVEVLNEALATGIVCVLRHRRHFYTATGITVGPVAAEFLQHANEELAHVDRIAMRIVQLQGSPNFDPASLTDRSHSEYDASDDLIEMIQEDLVAERVAIASYSDVIRWLGDEDETTRRLLEDILAMEEEYADDLLNLLTDLHTPSLSRMRGEADPCSASR